MPENGDVLLLLGEYLASACLSNSTTVHNTLAELRRVFPGYKSTSVCFQNTAYGGIGVFASRPISRGDLLLVEHPLISVPDVDLAASPYSQTDGGDSLLISEQIALSMTETIEKCFRTLYPIRTKSPDTLDVTIPADLETRLREVLPEDINPKLLLRAVQLNSLGYYTFPELVNYDDGLRFLAGTGIYKDASMFNHSCNPNVNHYSIGDVTFVRALVDIDIGEELFISYIGRDLLVEAKSIRHDFLDGRDFECACSRCSSPVESPDPWLEELGVGTRVKLRLLKSHEDRITYIERMLREHAYIDRDCKELKFALAREKGTTDPKLWSELPGMADVPVDFQDIVYRMHYLNTFGENQTVLQNIENSSQILLGSEFGTLSFIQGLFRMTDFR